MPKYLNNKRVLIGITGGIAAYKVLELIRRLREQEAHVKVILTAAGKEFVTPLSIQALTGEKVYSELLSADNEAAMSHIELARWADVLLVAPATANFMAKYTAGLADDLLTTVCLATTADTLIAPAMNQQMWLHQATQNNITTLTHRGVEILGPGNGSQACGEFGPGRMLEPSEIFNALESHFAPKILTGKHLLITAGPTRENLDPVRFISNHSSGKMGYALANAALKLGAHVTLISGPCNLIAPNDNKLTFVSIISATDMYKAVMQHIDNLAHKVDYFIGCAAVADYTPIKHEPQKIKKTTDTISLELQRTTDILAAVAALPANTRPFTVGFAAETQDLINNAQHKLQDKCLDLIFANVVGSEVGFNQDHNQIVIIGKNLQVIELPSMRKSLLAFKLLEEMEHYSSI